MKKVSAKILSFAVVGIVGMMSLFALGTVHGQFDNQNTTYNPTVPGSTALQNDKLITSVKTGINRVLGILALIALIVLIWGGFQMVTAAGDDGKYKKGFKILEQAAIGLIFVGVSWLVVSVIFWLIGLFTA